MNKFSKAPVFGALLLFGAAGCADLDVKNPNAPDRAGALAKPSDVVSLVSGSYNSWYSATHTYFMLPLSNASFQHVAPWANFGMYKYSLFPRAELINSPADQDYSLMNIPWTRNYRAIAAVASGLGAINDESTGVADELDEETVTLANAFGNYVLGLAHASIAVLFDRGFVVDETTDLSQEQEAQTYEQVMEAANGYFQKAIDLANAGGFTVPATYMNTPSDVTADEFARVIHSQRAVFKASLPRTGAERSIVDWNSVLADIQAGVQGDFIQNQDYYDGWWNSYLDYSTWGSWQQLPYFVWGMADQSGNYQTWLNTPLGERNPIINGENILIITPDQRFPQGTTLEEQNAAANRGSKLRINHWRNSNWAQAARGTWRWSYYRSHEWDSYNSWSDFHTPEVEEEEMTLLAAEAHYWLGNLDEAANLINISRTAAGLNATDASGTNTSCVPKLPNGQCGDLLEMLKWEKRVETWQTGVAYGLSWYFDGRRWDELYLGTPLQLPIPAGELQTLLMPVYSFGGVGGEWASDGSVYAYPGEN